MDHADRLRVGPWAPRLSRLADRVVMDDRTAEYGLPVRYGQHRPRTDTLVDHFAPPTLPLPPGPGADVLDTGGRGHHCARRPPRGPLLGGLVLMAVAVAAVVALAAPGTQPGSRSPGAAPFGAAGGIPTTYEAEAPANTLIGAAAARTYPGASGGVIVQTLGNWGPRVGQGALRFNDVTVPVSGTYDVTLYYVAPNNEPTRTVVITASGAGSVSVTVAGNATCCSAQMIRMELDKGTNSITLSNPAGHAPAIDKIVVGADEGP